MCASRHVPNVRTLGVVPAVSLVASHTRIALMQFLFSTSLPYVAAAANLTATWNGGAGNWSNAGNWNGQEGG